MMDDVVKKRKMNERLQHSVSAPGVPVGNHQPAPGATGASSSENGGASTAFNSEAMESNVRKLRTIASLYEVGDELGKGAFSIVYRGKDRASGEEVAIKVIRFSSFAERERVRQERILENEIRIMNRIMTHCEDTKNLIKIKDVVREKTRLAIVMELLEGKELFDRIIERTKYTEKDAAVLFRSLVKAVKTMHKAGIVHRDLKPENLVFASDAEDAPIKISDFGLAMIQNEPDVHQTVVGTPNYVAPEVVSINPRGPFYSTACDVWSMGVILYILLVGYPPFYNENVRMLFKQIRAGSYEFHKDQWQGISAEAIDLVKKILVVDPKRRLTCDQILTHPWMRNAPNSELGNTLEKMKKLTAKARFKAAAMAVVWGAQLGLRRKLLQLVDSTEAKVFNLDELQRIRASFQLHADTSNQMDEVAFCSTMKRLGFGDLPIERMFEIFDRNGDGKIDYKEFLGSLATLRQSGEDALKLCFQIYDDNNSGSISKHDISKVLETILGVPPADLASKLETIFQKLDTNGDGEISYEEFKAGIFSEPVLVQAFLQPMDGIAHLPAENFVLSDINRGIIDARYISE